MAKYFSRTTNWTFLLSFICLITFLFAISKVQALTVGCEKVWEGASAENELTTCLTNTNRIGQHWRFYLYPGFAALLFVLLLILFPLFFCVCVCNNCRCCSCCIPTSAAQHYNGPCCLYLATFIALLWGAGATVAIIMGAHTMYTGAHTVINKAKYTTAQYYNDTANQVYAYATNGVNNTEDIPEGFVSNIQVIFDINENVTNNIDEFDDKYLKYINDAAILSYSIGWLPFVLLLFALFFGCFRVSRAFPALFSCIYFFLGLIFALIAIIFLVAAYFSTALNGEIDRQVVREPGILQWYVVPYFNTNFLSDIETLNTELERLVTQRVLLACTSVNENCDATVDFTTQKPFYCAEALTCSSVQELDEISRTTLVKDPTYCNTGITDNINMNVNNNNNNNMGGCTIASCAINCINDTEIPTTTQARAASINIMNFIGAAVNSSIAQNLVSPLRDANMIADSILWSTGTVPEILEGFWMAGTGYFVSVLVFSLGIYIMLRGRIVWGEYVDPKRV